MDLWTYGPIYTLPMSCLFCRIASGEIPASKVYEDDEVLAFNDINPQAPLHVLVIPRRHISTTNDLSATDDGLVGTLVRRAAAIAQEKSYADRGYRVAFDFDAKTLNCHSGFDLHLLAGRGLGWPPG